MDGTSFEALFAQADRMLYREKSIKGHRGLYQESPEPRALGMGEASPIPIPLCATQKITRKGADWQMDHIRFEPTSNGDQLQEHAAELLSALDHIFLSVVKLELDTGRAWLPRAGASRTGAPMTLTGIPISAFISPFWSRRRRRSCLPHSPSPS